MSVTAISNGDMDSYRVYQGEVDTLATLCASGNHSYLAGLLQNANLQYQRMYVAFIDALYVNGYAPDIDVSTLLEDFADSFNQAKSNYGRYSKQVLFAGIFGLEPFAGKVGAHLQQHQDIDPAEQRYISEYLSELVGFLRDISLQNPEDNHRDIYIGYTQFLFVLQETAPVDSDAKRDLLIDLNDNFARLIQKDYRRSLEAEENLDHGINRRITDFYALLIYFYREDPDSLATFLDPLVNLYIDLVDDYPSPGTINERTLHRLYQELKIFGAWISQSHDLDNINPELKEVLTQNFKEVDTSGRRIYTSTLQRYDYPSNSTTHRDGWWLRPDTIWTNGFQDQIYNTLNGSGNQYEEFHNELRDLVEETS